MILVDNNVVIAVMNEYEQKENGKLINGTIYPMGEVIDIIAPSEVIPQKYGYNGEFYVRNEWLATEEAIKQQAIDDYTLELIDGGVI